MGKINFYLQNGTTVNIAVDIIGLMWYYEVKIRKDGTVKTSKQNKSEHGFGIKNVQKAVQNVSMNSKCKY